jgi:hypothetical protein
MGQIGIARQLLVKDADLEFKRESVQLFRRLVLGHRQTDRQTDRHGLPQILQGSRVQNFIKISPAVLDLSDGTEKKCQFV